MTTNHSVTSVMVPKDFKNFIRALTRAKALVNDTVFLMKNDILVPKKRTQWNRPGKHYIQGFPVPQPYTVVTYEFNPNVLFDAIKGCKGKLQPVIITFDNEHIGFSIQYGPSTVLVTPGKAIPEASFPEEHQSFDDVLNDINWTDFTMEELQMIKNKQPLELVSEEGATVRIARDAFKLAGVEQAKNQIKYSGSYGFSGDPRRGVMMLYIAMKYEFARSLHVYPFALYTPCGSHTYEEL